jgi:uncharacterized BrkB/YihY/UPF0761 family membrane protein
MSSSSLIRLGGLAPILAGALMIITVGAQVMGAIDFANIAEEATTGTYALLAWLVVLSVILLQGGLVALYAECSEAMGVLGQTDSQSARHMGVLSLAERAGR